MHLSSRAITRYLILVFSIVFIGLSVSFIQTLSFSDSSYNFTGKTKRVKLDPGKPVWQTFIAKEDFLNQMRVSIGNASLHLGENIVFELADPSCEHVIASDTKTIFSSKTTAFTIFAFDAIPDSYNKTYCARFTYFSHEDRGDDRPFIVANDSPQFADASYTNTSSEKTFNGRSLQMRPSYGNPSFTERLHELNNRLSQYKPDFLKGEHIAIIALLFFLGTFLLTILFLLL